MTSGKIPNWDLKKIQSFQLYILGQLGNHTFWSGRHRSSLGLLSSLTISSSSRLSSSLRSLFRRFSSLFSCFRRSRSCIQSTQEWPLCSQKSLTIQPSTFSGNYSRNTFTICSSFTLEMRNGVWGWLSDRRYKDVGQGLIINDLCAHLNTKGKISYFAEKKMHITLGTTTVIIVWFLTNLSSFPSLHDFYQHHVLLSSLPLLRHHKHTLYHHMHRHKYMHVMSLAIK